MGEGRVLALVAADGAAPVAPGAALLEEMLAGGGASSRPAG